MAHYRWHIEAPNGGVHQRRMVWMIGGDTSPGVGGVHEARAPGEPSTNVVNVINGR